MVLGSGGLRCDTVDGCIRPSGLERQRSISLADIGMRQSIVVEQPTLLKQVMQLHPPMPHSSQREQRDSSAATAHSRLADRAVGGHILGHLIQLRRREGRSPQRAFHKPLLRLELHTAEGAGAECGEIPAQRVGWQYVLPGRGGSSTCLMDEKQRSTDRGNRQAAAAAAAAAAPTAGCRGIDWRLPSRPRITPHLPGAAWRRSRRTPASGCERCGASPRLPLLRLV